MKKQLLILFSLLLFLIATGCKETHCPAFPKAVADIYFPYTENSVLVYTNSNGDTLTFTIDFYELTGSYSFKRNCDCACEAGASFLTKREPETLKMDGNIILFDNEAVIMVYVYNNNGSNDFHVGIDGINPFSSENVRLFGDTIYMKQQTNKHFTDMQLIAGKGITRFFDKGRDCEWVLVEDFTD